jgi:hypothetical protein
MIAFNSSYWLVLNRRLMNWFAWIHDGVLRNYQSIRNRVVSNVCYWRVTIFETSLLFYALVIENRVDRHGC